MSNPARPPEHWQCHHCDKDGVGEPFIGTIEGHPRRYRFFCSGECRVLWSFEMMYTPPPAEADALVRQQHGITAEADDVKCAMQAYATAAFRDRGTFERTVRLIADLEAELARVTAEHQQVRECFQELQSRHGELLRQGNPIVEQLQAELARVST